MTTVVHVEHPSDPDALDPSGFGVSVRTVDSAQGVFDALAAGDVDCVLCGVDAASGDGLDVVRAVRDRAPSLPVLAYSSTGDGAVATEATRAGATEYVSAERLGDANATLRDHVRDLTAQETPLGPIVESAPDPTVLLGDDLTVRYLNAAADASVPAVEEGASFLDVLHEADVDVFRTAVEAEGEAVVRVRGASGGWQPLSLRVADRRTDRRVRGVVLTAREVDAVSVDEDVVAQAVHDLRTPLATARTYLDIAREDPDRLEDVETAHDRLEELVSDVRTLAAARTDVDDPEPVDLTAVARDAWETAGAADVEFVVDDLTVTGNEPRLRRLFENLFRNACEHGASTVRLSAVDGRDGFAVSDDGDGIPVEDRESVFTQGYTTRDEGTGYGLAIVRSVADAHGFDAAVEESDGGGARFVFTR